MIGAAAALVDTHALIKVILYSLGAGVGIAIVFGAGVSSAANLLEAVRARQNALSTVWGVLTIVFIAAVIAVIVLGLIVLSAKS